MRPFEPQQPCPSCNKPMDGVGWINAPHDCNASDALACRHSEFWTGPLGNCPTCSTEQVAVALLESMAEQMKHSISLRVKVGKKLAERDWQMDFGSVITALGEVVRESLDARRE